MEQPTTENDSPATMPEQPTQETTSMGVSDGQPLNRNGVDVTMGVTVPQFDATGVFLPGQDTGFTTLQPFGNGVNGMVYPDANLTQQFAVQQMSVGGDIPPIEGKSISADEIALYDRQIRLWGMQAQQKIQGARVLLITMKALANEIAKNLVLAGIGSLTIVDDETVTEADLGAGFSLSQGDIGKNRGEAARENLKKLNPRVEINADPESIMKKGASFFGNYNIVIATDLNPTTLAFINTATRLHSRQFYAAASHGFYGYIFSDLIEHDYVLQRDKGNVPTKIGPESRTRSVVDVKTKKEGSKTIEMVTKRELYSTWDIASETSRLPAEYRNSKRRLKAVTPALSCLRALWSFQAAQGRNPGPNRQDLEFFTKSATQNHQLLNLPSETLKSEFLRSFLQNIGSEIAPVTAILGGQLAQDVINVLGANQPPIQNMVIFDGIKMQADMYPLHPESEVSLGKAQLDLSAIIAPTVPPVLSLDPAMYSSLAEFPGPAI